MRFELHCHSNYSRGTKIHIEAPQSPREIIREAKRKGLDGLALTDHDTIKGWKQAKDEAKKLNMLFIPAAEITTKSGHMTALGLNSLVKKGLSVDETMDKIHEQGGIGIAVHPFDVRGEGIRTEIYKTDAVEVFNSVSLDKISNRLAEKHAKKLNKPMVAGSDAHSLDMLGSSVNIIKARTADSVLREIKKGRVSMEKNYITIDAAVAWSRERMTISYHQVMNYIKNNYSQPKAWLAHHLLNSYVFSAKDNEHLLWRYIAKFSFGCTGLYSRVKLLKYY